eukprot:44793-Amphidinium_carterae.1
MVCTMACEDTKLAKCLKRASWGGPEEHFLGSLLRWGLRQLLFCICVTVTYPEETSHHGAEDGKLLISLDLFSVA